PPPSFPTRRSSDLVINAYYLARLVRPNGLGEERAGRVHVVEIAGNQREAMDHPITVVVEADDFPIGSDAEGGCIIQSAGKVNGREITRAQQKAVGISRGVHVGADDLVQIIHVLNRSTGSARRVKDRE